MADLSTIVPKMHADMFRSFYEKENVWLNKVMDVSGVFPRAGKTYQIPIDITPYDDEGDQAGGATLATGGAILADDSANFTEDSTVAQLTWGAPRLQKVDNRELTLDQEREANILIPPLADIRTLPSLTAASVMNIAYVTQKAISYQIRGKFDGQGAAYQIQGPTIASAAADWGNTAHINAIYKLLRDATLKADEWQWPDANRVVVVNPALWDLIAEVIVTKNIYMQGGANADAFLRGVLTDVRGWRCEKDKSIPQAHAQPADGDNHNFYFLSERMGVGHAREYRENRTFNSEVYKGWLSRMIVTFGTAILNERYQMLGKTTITAA